MSLIICIQQDLEDHECLYYKAYRETVYCSLVLCI